MACFTVPEEILVSEIFMRLPATCIMTLRSVCRSWRRLTTDPSFVCAHARTRRAAAAIAAEPVVFQLNGCPTEDGELHLLKLDAHDADNVIGSFSVRTIPGSGPILRLTATCDGLLCFQPEDCTNQPKPYYVCNPVTKIWTTVAAASDRAAAVRGRRVNGRCLCGFYFHRSTGEHRLLHYSSNYADDRIPIWLEGAYEVATVGGEDKSWRSIHELRLTADRAYAPAEDYDGTEALALLGFRAHSSVAVNGRLHWLLSIAAEELGVVVFDTESEKFSRMSAPIGPNDGLYPFQMNKMRGNLCVGRMMGDGCGGQIMELWMLREYETQQWAKLHTIRPDRSGFVKTILPHGGVRDSEEEDGELLVRWDVSSFANYNFKLKTYKQTTITSELLYIADMFTNFYGADLLRYTESLIDPRTRV